jgi:hypothetical protein
MDIQETKVITEVKTVIVGYKCDNCGKIHNGDFPDEWHHFSSHHNEWGNDSIDSYEYYDVCSPECYVDKLTDVVESEMSGIHNGDVDGMKIQFARRMVEYFKNF